MAVPGHLSSLLRAAELREVCYRAKAAAYLREMISEVDACNRYDAAKIRGRSPDDGGPGCRAWPTAGFPGGMVFGTHNVVISAKTLLVPSDPRGYVVSGPHEDGEG